MLDVRRREFIALAGGGGLLAGSSPTVCYGALDPPVGGICLGIAEALIALNRAAD
jgi:hypothetical protein